LNDLANARYHVGLDSELSPLGLEKNLLAAAQLLAEVEKEIAFDRHMIKMLIGKGPDSPDLEDPLDADFKGAFSLPGQLSIDLLARRPDLQALIWKVESAGKEIGIAKTEFYPNINLSLFAGLESLAFGDLFKWVSRTGGVEPALHLPIFTAGRLRANLRSKVAFYNETVFSYNALLLKAVQEVADRLVQFQTKYEEFDIQKGIVL
ncbi:MAG: TolC family protein, partial [Chlamydiales bacterium]|nr:TolC family protein [Chlamydiales bacterium]